MIQTKKCFIIFSVYLYSTEIKNINFTDISSYYYTLIILKDTDILEPDLNDFVYEWNTKYINTSLFFSIDDAFVMEQEHL